MSRVLCLCCDTQYCQRPYNTDRFNNMDVPLPPPPPLVRHNTTSHIRVVEGFIRRQDVFIPITESMDPPMLTRSDTILYSQDGMVFGPVNKTWDDLPFKSHSRGKGKKPQKYRVLGDEAQLLLTRDKIATIDKSDLEQVLDHRWVADYRGHTWYGRSSINGRRIYLHRYILNIDEENLHVEHMDGEGLNDIKNNLQVVPRQRKNKTPFKKEKKEQRDETYLEMKTNEYLSRDEGYLAPSIHSTL